MPDSTRARVIDVDALSVLVAVLRQRGYTVVGPTVRDGAIVLAELHSAEQLPYGWGVETDAGRYRLVARQDRAAFAHAAGPQSAKSVLHPARARLWSADRTADGTGRQEIVAGDEGGPPPRYALLGVRPCDLRAIGILDTVLAGGHREPVYGQRRDGLFVIAVECTEPAATCFCVSMGGGPAVPADNGDSREPRSWDLALTELLDTTARNGRGAGHRFVVRAATTAGEEVLAALPAREADEATVRSAREAVALAATRMGRTMPSVDLRQLLVDRRFSPHWADVASRCLTCGNCTMVCPTCFCTTTEDVTDLNGQHAQRWRTWDSCFALDFTYMHGLGGAGRATGAGIRSSGESRYRQWISHKLSTWHDQFGSTGCVGCGRCVAWCPVGIDITAEATALVDQRPEVTR